MDKISPFEKAHWRKLSRHKNLNPINCKFDKTPMKIAQFKNFMSMISLAAKPIG